MKFLFFFSNILFRTKSYYFIKLINNQISVQATWRKFVLKNMAHELLLHNIQNMVWNQKSIIFILYSLVNILYDFINLKSITFFFKWRNDGHLNQLLSKLTFFCLLSPLKKFYMDNFNMLLVHPMVHWPGIKFQVH